jgi:hypothetical protein
MTELLRIAAELRRDDRKAYRRHPFALSKDAGGLRITFTYDPGQPFPHSLLTLSLFDPRGFRGAGHRYSPRQTIELGPGAATPGFVAGPIPAGEWMVEVDVHCVIARPDGAPNAYELLIETVPEGEPRLELRRAGPSTAGAPPSRGPAWYRGELHLHTTHSDGTWSPAEMAEEARGRGLDFMFLTDHNTNTGTLDLRRAVEGRTLVLPGAELTTFNGHALALGIDRWIDWRTGHAGRSANDVARAVREAGGLFVVAHPDALPDDVCTGCRWTHDGFDPALANGVEVWGGLWDGPEERNAGCVALWHRWLDAGHRLTATGATDAHHKKHWEGAVPLTYVYADELSGPALLEALRSGRTFVSSGPELDLRAVLPGIGDRPMGATVPATARIEARCQRSPKAVLRLVSSGVVTAQEEVTGSGLVTAPAGGATWHVAELWDAEGKTLLAITSPVYVG